MSWLLVRVPSITAIRATKWRKMNSISFNIWNSHFTIGSKCSHATKWSGGTANRFRKRGRKPTISWTWSYSFGKFSTSRKWLSTWSVIKKTSAFIWLNHRLLMKSKGREGSLSITTKLSKEWWLQQYKIFKMWKMFLIMQCWEGFWSITISRAKPPLH